MEYFKETHYHHCHFALLYPLTQQLNKLNTGHEEHKTKREVTHSLYTDDLKLMGKTEEELQKQMQVVRNYSDDIDTEFGLDKCAKTVLKRGKLIHSQNLILGFNTDTRARRGKSMQVPRY